MKARNKIEELARTDYSLLPTKEAHELCLKKDIENTLTTLKTELIKEMPKSSECKCEGDICMCGADEFNSYRQQAIKKIDEFFS